MAASQSTKVETAQVLYDSPKRIISDIASGLFISGQVYLSKKPFTKGL